jgi:hypothetical protein
MFGEEMYVIESSKLLQTISTTVRTVLQGDGDRTSSEALTFPFISRCLGRCPFFSRLVGC